MKVIHIVHGKVNPKGHNALSKVVFNLVKNLKKHSSLEHEIWAVVDNIKSEMIVDRGDNVKVRCFPRVRFPKYSLFLRQLNKESSDIILAHFHIMWFLDKNFIAGELKSLSIPYIYTTHGTYSKPHAYTGKRRLARITELSFIRGAVAIHTITREEGTSLRKYGYKGPVFTIPNGITDFAPDSCSSQRNNRAKDVFCLAWVGVFRTDKNLDELLDSLTLLPPDLLANIKLKMIGPDYKSNKKDLVNKIEKLGLKNTVDILGPLYGEEKVNFLASCDCLIMPSESEVLSLAVLDGFAVGLPAIVSSGCGFIYYRDWKFLEICEPYSSDLALGIEAMYLKRDKINAEEIILTTGEVFNWEAVSASMNQRYLEVTKYVD